MLVATLRNVLGLLQIGGDAQGIAIGLLLIGSLLISNTAEQLLDRARTRRLLGTADFARPAPLAAHAAGGTGHLDQDGHDPGRVER